MPKTNPRIPEAFEDDLVSLKISVRSLKARLTTLETRLPAQEVLLAQQHAFTAQIGKLALETLSRKDEAAEELSGSRLARILTAARASTYSAVDYTVGRLRKAERHVAQATKDAAKARSASTRKLLLDYCARFRQWRDEELKVLRDLCVTVCQVKVGDAVDEERMLVFGELPAEDPRHVGTVAQVHQQAFRFRDEHGNAQIIPAEVDVYVAPAEETAGADGREELVAAALEAITTSDNGHGTRKKP